MYCVQASQDGLGGILSVLTFGLLGRDKGVKRSDAEKAVQQIYLELLLRDPLNPRDPGMKGFVNCLVAGWCDVDFVRTEILKSPEFRELQEKLVTQELERAKQFSGSSTFAFGLPALPSVVAGVPLPVIIGGVVLLFLMMKKR